MWIDRFVKISLLFLIFFTPLAFGSVHAWAYSLAEGVVALMVMAWALKIWLGRKVSSETPRVRAWPYALPLTLFIGFVLLQLVPLKPSWLQVISPSTYEVYEKALPGWPERVPFADLAALAEEDKETRRQGDKGSGRGGEWETGRMGESKNGGHVGGETTSLLTLLYPYLPFSHSPIHSSWLPLSIAPTLTKSDLLKFTTYALLFFLILFYPTPGTARDPYHHAEYEIEFLRPFLYAILISAFLVGILGFVNLFTWNGRVLWFFVPHDASGGGSGLRAAAPFIAPPSFANYLAVTLPLIAMAAFGRSFLTPGRLGAAFRVLCGFAGFIMFCGILLSLSRAGWASAGLGVGVLILLAVFGRGGQSWIARTPVRRLITFSIAGFCLFLVVALVFVGPQGQENLDLRLQETATEATSLHGRFAVWRDSLEMAQDFRFLGVGLGAWSDIFPHYQHPRLNGFYREAHNDYLELLTETGAVGAFLLIWFFVVCLGRIVKNSFSLDPQVFPVVAALVAGMFAMAFHEMFDFNLQIPANAILFTILLAVSLRLASASGDREQAKRDRQETTGKGEESKKHVDPQFPPHSEHPTRRAPVPRPFPSAASPFPAIAGSVILAACSILLFNTAFSQPMSTYPYYLRKQVSLGDALTGVRNHPANAEAHMTLFDAVKDKKGAAWQLEALNTILWLAPGKTAVRDTYASRLFLQGRREEALYEVTRSVAQSPSVNRHFYLSRSVAPTLFPSEQQAIIFGFRKAIEDGHPEALEGLAEFYGRTQRFLDRLALYEEAAADAREPNEKADFLLKAADTAVKAQDGVKAENLLLEATRLQPGDTMLYTKLISQVYEPRKDLVAVETVVAEGIRNGAEAFTLHVSLAEAARSNGDTAVAERALRKALVQGSNGTHAPRDRYRSYVWLARVAGSIGLDDVQEQALNKAIEFQPNSYRALMEVGAMHEARKDYTRAVFYYRKATRANRSSADAFARLAGIEERRFHFSEADGAYAQAVRLAPKDEGLKERYESFKKRVEKGKEEGEQAIGNRQ